MHDEILDWICQSHFKAVPQEYKQLSSLSNYVYLVLLN